MRTTIRTPSAITTCGEPQRCSASSPTRVQRRCDTSAPVRRFNGDLMVCQHNRARWATELRKQLVRRAHQRCSASSLGRPTQQVRDNKDEEHPDPSFIHSFRCVRHTGRITRLNKRLCSSVGSCARRAQKNPTLYAETSGCLAYTLLRWRPPPNAATTRAWEPRLPGTHTNSAP